MRELNECKAEVFRRSEKRIKKRQENRNRILALYIPLCLIITVCSFAILPMMQFFKGKNMTDGGDAHETGNGHGSWGALVRVELQSPDGDLQLSAVGTETNKISQIYNTIRLAFTPIKTEANNAYNYGSVSYGGVGSDKNSVSTEISSGYVDNTDMVGSGSVSDGRVDSDQNNGSTGISSGYKIIFTTDNCVRISYTLDEYTLINDDTGEKIILTPELRAELFSELNACIKDANLPSDGKTE